MSMSRHGVWAHEGEVYIPISNPEGYSCTTQDRLTNLLYADQHQFPRTFPGTESSVFQESPLFWVNGFNTIGHLLLTWNKQKRKCYQQSGCLWLVNDTPVYFQKWGKTRTSWWWTGKPGVLQSMGSQRVGHDWVTELNYGHLWLLSHYFKHFRVTLV